MAERGAEVGSRPLPVRILLGLLPALVLLAAAEATLALLGVADPARELDVSRGFDPRARYLVPDGSARGAYRTQMFDKHDEVVVPPKGERLRVLLLGGSNTEIFPEEELEHLLGEAASGPAAPPRFEVVNLGRSGYGSARVSILLEQALALLEPDAVVIYSGHNEFIERGFRGVLRERRAPAALAPLARLRSVRALSELIDPPRPEPWTMDYAELRDVTYEQTLRYLDAYERNLRAMCAAARRAGVPVVLCTLVSNMLSPAWGITLPPGTSEADAAEIERLLDRARARVPARCRRFLMPPVRVRALDWRALAPPGDDERVAFGFDAAEGARAAATAPPLDRPVPRLRALLGPFAETGTTPLAAPDAHWPPPEGWGEDVWTVLAGAAAVHDRQLTDEETRLLRDGHALYGEVLALCPDHPRALFMRGLCAYLLGDAAQGVELLARAARYDRAPRAANDATNERVRAVARGAPGLVLLDAAALFASRCPDGLVGYEVMMDHCHLQPGARTQLMRDLAPCVLVALGLAPAEVLRDVAAVQIGAATDAPAGAPDEAAAAPDATTGAPDAAPAADDAGSAPDAAPRAPGPAAQDGPRGR